MACYFECDPPPVIEPAMMETLFVNGILPPEDYGAFVQVSFYQVQRRADGTMQRVVVQRMAVTPDDFVRAVRTAMEAVPVLEAAWRRSMNG